jgi:hypothetical protein
VTGGPISGTRGSRITTLFVISTVALALASCSSGTSSDPRPSTSTSLAPPSSAAPTTPLSPVDQAKQAALAAYRGMWQDFVAAGATSDWQSPKLGQYATGLALSTLSRGMYADHYNGLVTKGEPVLNPTVVSVDPQAEPVTVIVNDCGDSTHFLKYRADNGNSANDGPGVRQFIKATVQKQVDSSWKVTDFGIQEVGSC